MGMRVTSGPDATMVVVISTVISLVIAILLWALQLYLAFACCLLCRTANPWHSMACLSLF